MKNRITISLILILAIGLTYLLINAGSTKVSRVFIPSELLEHSEAYFGEIRLAGQVAEQKINYQVQPEIKLEFSLVDRKNSKGENDQNKFISISYQGIKPDMFAVGRDVIVEGRYDGQIFKASKLLTQCPSKYEPPKPG